MKKTLLATTAVIGMAFAAQPAHAQLELTIGGDVSFQIGVFDDDGLFVAPAGSSDRDFQAEADIILSADGVADNGLEYGGKIVVQASPGSVDQDQPSVYLAGSWGWLGGGDLQGASYNLFAGAPNVGTGQIEGDYEDYVGVQGTIRPYDSDYSTKIVYYTPEFSGFQGGVAYAPEQSSLGENIVVSGNFAGAAGFQGNLGPGAFFGTYNAAIARGTQNRQEDIFEIAAAWSGEFDQFGVNISGSYVTGDAKGAPGAAPVFGDIDAYGLGLQVTFGGFTFGGAYVDNDDSNLPIVAGQSTDWESWNIGATYENGPWGVGVSYEDNELDLPVTLGPAAGTSQSFDYDIFGIGGVYALAEGLDIELDINFVDVEVPAAAKAAGTAFQDLDTYVGTLTTRATF